MKKAITMTALLFCVLLSACGIGNFDTSDTSSNVVNASRNDIFIFFSYSDYYNWIAETSKGDLSSAWMTDLSIEYFKMVKDYPERIVVPHFDGEAIPILPGYGVSFYGKTLFGYPWAYFTALFNGEGSSIRIACAQFENEVKSMNSFIKELYPTAPNVDNSTDFLKYYSKIEEKNINIGGKETSVLWMEDVRNDMVYVLFIYNGHLVEVYAKLECLTETMWKSFSVAPLSDKQSTS